MYLHRGFDLHSGRQRKEDRLKTDLWLLLGLVWELGSILGFLLLGESWSWILISHHCETTKNFVLQLFLLNFLASCLLRRKYFNRKTDVECQAHFSAFFLSRIWTSQDLVALASTNFNFCLSRLVRFLYSSAGFSAPPSPKVGKCLKGKSFMQKGGLLQCSFLLSGICCLKSWHP